MQTIAAGVAPLPAAADTEAVHRLEDNVARVIRGKREVIRLATVCLLARGHVLIEDVPGRRQDHPGPGPGPLARPLLPAHPVHQRPAAVGHHRRLDLQPEEPGVRVRARAAVRQRRAGRRDQPRHAQDPVGAARGDERAQGLGRAQALLAARAVRGARHPEPARVPGHLPAARVAARPLPDVALAGLPAARGRARAAALGRRRGPARATCSRCVSRDELLDAAGAGRPGAAWPRSSPTTCCRSPRPPATAASSCSASRPAALQSLFRATQALALCEGRAYAIPDDVQRLAAPVLAHRVVLKRGAATSTARARRIERVVAATPVPL